MSILIKGMKMPENCYKCPFAMEYYSTLHMSEAGKFRKDYCCVITHKTLTSTKRSRFCPLIEVPTPHGRLIDATKIDFSKVFIGATSYAAEARLSANYLINIAPTIIEAEKEDCV